MKRGAVIGVLLESKALALRSKRPPEVQSALRLLRLTGPGFWTGPAERVHHGGWRGMPPSDRTLAQRGPARVADRALRWGPCGLARARRSAQERCFGVSTAGAGSRARLCHPRR